MQILEAKKPEDLFGEDPDEAPKKYKELILEHHPDKGGDANVAAHINKMWYAASASIVAGSYGKPEAPLADPIKVQSKRHMYTVTNFMRQDEIANYFRAYHGTNDEVVFKVVRNERDNDLLQAEAKSLKHLLSDKEGYDLTSPYLPGYVETFGYKVKSAKGKPKQTNVFTIPEKEFHTLEQVRLQYPELHAKDMAWMFRRLLYSLGLVHSSGLIHGGITPASVLIQAEQHGLLLTNWVYSTQGEPLKAISSKYKDLYPNEVLEKQKPMPGTDIYMAVKCMEYLVGPTAPRPIRAFFKGCSQRAVSKRPQDALGLLDEFNTLVEEMWGPRRFRPFDMPTVTERK